LPRTISRRDGTPTRKNARKNRHGIAINQHTKSLRGAPEFNLGDGGGDKYRF